MTDAWSADPASPTSSTSDPAAPAAPAVSEPASSPSTQPAEPAPEAATPAASTPAAAPDPAPAPAPEPSTAPAPEPAAPSLKVGAIVRHPWEDPTGEHEAFGLVVEVNTDGDSPRAAIVWFSGRSGLIPADDLEVIEEG